MEEGTQKRKRITNKGTRKVCQKEKKEPKEGYGEKVSEEGMRREKGMKRREKEKEEEGGERKE